MSSYITCPKCGQLAKKGSFRAWQIVVSIVFFPLGLLSLLAGRRPHQCHHCGNIWE